MNRQNMPLWLLSCTAALLMLGCIFVERPVHAQVSERERDYSMVTMGGAGGSDILYVANNRRGVFAVFVWDTASRSLQVRDVKPINLAFGGGR